MTTLGWSLISDAVCIDAGAEPIYGSDQVYLDYPCRFATVTFALHGTDLLSSVADKIRLAEHEEARPISECNGWYNFYITLCDWDPVRKVGSYIEFVVVDDDEPDNEELYTINLSNEERDFLYRHLDEQCKSWFKKSCKELLDEAREELKKEH